MRELPRLWLLACLLLSMAWSTRARAQQPTLSELRTLGAQNSSLRDYQPRTLDGEAPQPDIAAFRTNIAPILENSCVACHGEDTQEGNIRLDTLDPDLVNGEDGTWWLEVLAVLTNGEMPPADGGELTDADRQAVIEWLSSEVQLASAIRRTQSGHSSFRRMTRYEYNYALQDLLGLSYDFAKDLPLESASEDGFQNSTEMLHISSNQLAVYREASRTALARATAQGERPAPTFWQITSDVASRRMWKKVEADLAKLRKRHQNDPQKLAREIEKLEERQQRRPGGAHYFDRESGKFVQASWGYGGARYAFASSKSLNELPESSPIVAVIPSRQRLIVELGNEVPDHGTMQVRIRAARVETSSQALPSLRLEFGWQASNNSHASVDLEQEIVIDGPPGEFQFYQWEFPLGEIYPRNPMRKTAKMGETPSPSEYIKFVNSALSKTEVQIDYVEVVAPVYQQWPPASHQRVLLEREEAENEEAYALRVLSQFTSRAWRRPITSPELQQKLGLYRQLRPHCDTPEEALVEVLATVLSSPKFLYLTQSQSKHETDGALSDFELATRLSMFLWCSVPDEELQSLAASGELNNPQILTQQVQRMLADPKAERFATQFVRQWLGMQLLDYLNVDREVYPQFDPMLKQAMQQEPVVFFREVLQSNHSVLDFLHADYVMVNERLARHYGWSNIYGNEFRRVDLEADSQRGGLLTQAGLLAMNSDGKDSHPLKRGIWLLESLLNDPPPPPPPAVPEIDLADPEIAKLTLKQRIEDHRNQAACMSCHAKIDPWGIAFENFDAIGSWRTSIQGVPVDATSTLFNQQKLDGMDGLKRFLLRERQDQFARSLTHKMTTFALGRPLTFADRSSVDQIAADLRKQGDGLADLVTLIVTSPLFRSQ